MNFSTVPGAQTSDVFGWRPWWRWADWWGPLAEWAPRACPPQSSCDPSALSWPGTGRCSPAELETLKHNANIRQLYCKLYPFHYHTSKTIKVNRIVPHSDLGYTNSFNIFVSWVITAFSTEDSQPGNANTTHGNPLLTLALILLGQRYREALSLLLHHPVRVCFVCISVKYDVHQHVSGTANLQEKVV